MFRSVNRNLILLLLLLCSCSAIKKTDKPGKPRYQSSDNIWLNQWMDAEHPRKVTPTGKRMRKSKMF